MSILTALEKTKKVKMSVVYQFHVFSLADDLKEKGWLFSCLQYPTWYVSRDRSQ